ncbi:hypothetical protein LSAT2_006708, partial [Lamellibrachia satsuma]
MYGGIKGQRAYRDSSWRLDITRSLPTHSQYNYKLRNSGKIFALFDAFAQQTNLDRHKGGDLKHSAASYRSDYPQPTNWGQSHRDSILEPGVCPLLVAGPKTIWKIPVVNPMSPATYGPPTALISGGEMLRAFAVDEIHGHVYWSDGNKHSISRAKLDGSGAEEIYTTGHMMRHDEAA